MTAHNRSVMVALLVSASASAGDSQTTSTLRLELRTTVGGSVVEFGRIGAIVADREGRMYVADVHRATQRIVLLAPDGRRIRSTGGRGNGPGQFTYLLPSLAWIGDTLLAMQAGGGVRRVTLFDSSGGVVATRTRPPLPDTAVSWSRLFTGGPHAYLIEIRHRPVVLVPGEPPPPMSAQAHYERFARDGSSIPVSKVVDSAAAIGGGAWGPPVHCQAGRFMQSFPPPFTDRGPLRAFTASGHLASAYLNEYRIDIIDPVAGAILRSIRRTVPRIPLRDEDWNSLPEIEEIRAAEKEWGSGPIESMGSRGTPCPVLQMRPEFLPVLRTVMTDDAGRLWVEATSRDGFTLAGFDGTGRFVGETTMPTRDPRVTPYIRGNLLYIATVDELGVQGIKVYAIAGGTL